MDWGGFCHRKQPSGACVPKSFSRELWRLSSVRMQPQSGHRVPAKGHSSRTIEVYDVVSDPEKARHGRPTNLSRPMRELSATIPFRDRCRDARREP